MDAKNHPVALVLILLSTAPLQALAAPALDTGQPSAPFDAELQRTGPTGPDADGDGFVESEDCDDNDPSVPFAVYLDQDMDDYGRGDSPSWLCEMPVNGASVNGDCDDTDPDTFPGAPEIPEDHKDNDCDGSFVVDNDGDGSPWKEDCDDDDPDRYPENYEIEDDGFDQDCDGWDGDRFLTGGSGLSCGCATGGPSGASWLLLLLPLWARRRRP